MSVFQGLKALADDKKGPDVKNHGDNHLINLCPSLNREIFVGIWVRVMFRILSLSFIVCKLRVRIIR